MSNLGEMMLTKFSQQIHGDEFIFVKNVLCVHKIKALIRFSLRD